VRPAGLTWSKVGLAPAFPGKLLALGDPDHLAYASGDGQFLRSTDGGRNWTLELRVR